MNDTQYTVEPLLELRRNALLMSIANSHLCEDVFLTKIGKSIEKSVLALKEDISALKKGFPGKFANEVDTDSMLVKINETAKAMLEPVDEIREKCVIGELGKDLEDNVKSVVSAVKNIKVQVFGPEVTYTNKDSVSKIFSPLKDFGSSLRGPAVQGLKILCLVIIIAIPVFSYLYFSMESEDEILAKISVNDTGIIAQQDLINSLAGEEAKVSAEIASLEKGAIDRTQKIAILDLEMEIHRISESRHKAEAEIAGFKDDNAKNLQTIEEIKRVPFIKRLLRLKH
ncbi:hypothetical protein ACFLZT_00120 [Thermodesulfobacteriota bacterium]